MKLLVFLFTLTAITTALFLSSGNKEYEEHLDTQKHLIEKATPVSGKIDTEFLEEIFGPANEQ